jgi:hypothetical protein
MAASSCSTILAIAWLGEPHMGSRNAPKPRGVNGNAPILPRKRHPEDITYQVRKPTTKRERDGFMRGVVCQKILRRMELCDDPRETTRTRAERDGLSSGNQPTE